MAKAHESCEGHIHMQDIGLIKEFSSTDGLLLQRIPSFALGFWTMFPAGSSGLISTTRLDQRNNCRLD
jgi:hypothetical protein